MCLAAWPSAAVWGFSSLTVAVAGVGEHAEHPVDAKQWVHSSHGHAPSTVAGVGELAEHPVGVKPWQVHSYGHAPSAVAGVVEHAEHPVDAKPWRVHSYGLAPSAVAGVGEHADSQPVPAPGSALRSMPARGSTMPLPARAWSHAQSHARSLACVLGLVHGHMPLPSHVCSASCMATRSLPRWSLVCSTSYIATRSLPRLCARPRAWPHARFLTGVLGFVHGHTLALLNV
jgi:hypothetical protein